MLQLKWKSSPNICPAGRERSLRETVELSGGKRAQLALRRPLNSLSTLCDLSKVLNACPLSLIVGMNLMLDLGDEVVKMLGL